MNMALYQFSLHVRLGILVTARTSRPDNYLSCCVTDKNVIARRPQADVAILKGNRLQAKNLILYEIATPRYGRGSQ